MEESDRSGLEQMQQTPERERPRQLLFQQSSPSPDRQMMRKKRRTTVDSGICVLEGSKAINPSSEIGNEAGAVSEQATQKQRPEAAFREAVENMPAGFAEDFFLGQGCTKHLLLNSLLTANAALPAPEAKSDATEEAPRSERFAVWADQLRAGFSLLVHGVGSKKQLLIDFVDEVVRPAGVALTHINAFDARFSLCEWFKALLEIAFPNAARSGVSAEALGAAVRAATETSSRPLCIVVHSLELLPQHHIVILSSLATCPGVHLVASVDSIWAPLAWSSCCLKNFNFCREEWNTFLSYEVESAARYPSGLPPWTGLGHDRRRAPKASLSLVLRSLTNNHRELVQAMAKRQLENGNRVGISLSALLKESTERMIAASVPKLRSLLNELKDHEVVIQRNSSAASAQMLFSLPYNDRMLQRLAQNTSLDSEDEADEVVGGGGEDEDMAAE